jgi:hypothetical protein
VELHFREIKITLALDVLRCLTPAMIEKELLLHIIAYNLIRSLMQRAAILHSVELRRLNFKGSLDTLRHFADAVHASEGKPRKQAALLDSMLEIIAADQVPYRAYRNEPRAKKRRPKNDHLLTKRRHQMRVPPTETAPNLAYPCAIPRRPLVSMPASRNTPPVFPPPAPLCSVPRTVCSTSDDEC